MANKENTELKELNSILKKIFIISGPSGAGKSTLIQLITKRLSYLQYCISHTTRSPRSIEKEGISYYFTSEENFNELLSKGLFLEHAKVHNNYYGTMLLTLKDICLNDKFPILDISVEGHKSILEYIPKEKIVSIFISPPSMKELSIRLYERHQESSDVIEARLLTAKIEMEQANNYDYIIINSDLSEAVTQLENIIKPLINL
jgi:guanylate kinase